MLFIKNLELQKEKGILSKDYLVAKLAKLERDHQKLTSISSSSQSGKNFLSSISTR